MKKIFNKKLMYVIAILAVLAMMIPAAIPVSAAGGTITMKLVSPVTPFAATDNDTGYNVTGSTVEITVTGDTVASWSKLDYVTGTNSAWVPSTPPGAVQTVRVTGVWGETVITATMTDNSTLSVDKKWGQIESTVITPPGSSFVTWNENDKAWEGSTSVTDTVYGDFVNKDGVHSTHPLQGVILNWYLVPSYANVNMGPAEAPVLMAAAAALPDSVFVGIDQASGAKIYRSVTNSLGQSTINLSAFGEESVKIVVVPEYPFDPQLDVVTEVTSYNFQTYEMEVVPQVRWVGEKIVLEKNFGDNYTGNLVNFVITSGAGALEQFGPIPNGIGLNLTSNSVSVWTRVNTSGLASVILAADVPGEVYVRAALYNGEGTVMVNQHAFLVYYLKLESLTLGDVDGKRAGHNSGLWTPENPYSTATDIMDLQTLNVSQDALERAQVKGWFMGANWSTRVEADQDINNDGEADLVLPAHRWVLPDDWGKLAGINNWQERRLHWDIMDAPNDNVYANLPNGSYNSVDGQTGTDVVGPFSPGIELMTPSGWDMSFTSPDPMRPYTTVVPNGALDAWDAPMPPAKIIFEIMAGVGYFKDANKADIYYKHVTIPGTPAQSVIVYTAPFYSALIPAHWAIPAFINNGGYDWDSFNVNYGPYVFWTVINQPSASAIVSSSDWANKPTKVEVYSDNHGEAMVWLNGDWNLDLSDWSSNGGYDVEPGATVGMTTVQAMADYPYVRSHQPIASNTVEKEWTWGKMILGTEPALYPNGNSDPISYRMVLQTGTLNLNLPENNNVTRDDWVAMSDKKMAWIWVTDRDMQNGELGWQIEWFIQTNGAVGVHIPPMTSLPGVGISNFNAITMAIGLQDGFLAGTNGHVTDTARTSGVSVTRDPTAAEIALFNKYYPGLDASKFEVAAVEVQCASAAAVDLTIYIHTTREGTQIRHTSLDFSTADRADDPVVLGDGNLDGTVNMGDVVAVERMILGLNTRTTNADANWDSKINMGDVVRIERTLLLGQ